MPVWTALDLPGALLNNNGPIDGLDWTAKLISMAHMAVSHGILISRLILGYVISLIEAMYEVFIRYPFPIGPTTLSEA